MRSFKIISFALILASGLMSAQKIGVVDTDYILSKLPQYKEAEQIERIIITETEQENDIRGYKFKNCIETIITEKNQFSIYFLRFTKH